KAVLRLGQGRLPPKLVELAEWMADYYICPLGMVLATMMPAAVKRGVGLRKKIEVAIAGPEEVARILQSAELTPATRKAWERLGALELQGAIDPKELAVRMSSRTLAPVNKLLAAGLLTRVERAEVRSRATVWESGRVDAAKGTPTLTTAQKHLTDGIGEGP